MSTPTSRSEQEIRADLRAVKADVHRLGDGRAASVRLLDDVPALLAERDALRAAIQAAEADEIENRRAETMPVDPTATEMHWTDGYKHALIFAARVALRDHLDALCDENTTALVACQAWDQVAALRAAIQAVEELCRAADRRGYHSGGDLTVDAIRAALAAAGVDREDTEQPHDFCIDAKCLDQGDHPPHAGYLSYQMLHGDTGQADEPQRHATAWCFHCGHTGPVGEDHSCPCPFSDEECTSHKPNCGYTDCIFPRCKTRKYIPCAGNDDSPRPVRGPVGQDTTGEQQQ